MAEARPIAVPDAEAAMTTAAEEVAPSSFTEAELFHLHISSGSTASAEDEEDDTETVLASSMVDLRQSNPSETLIHESQYEPATASQPARVPSPLPPSSPAPSLSSYSEASTSATTSSDFSFSIRNDGYADDVNPITRGDIGIGKALCMLKLR